MENWLRISKNLSKLQADVNVTYMCLTSGDDNVIDFEKQVEAEGGSLPDAEAIQNTVRFIFEVKRIENGEIIGQSEYCDDERIGFNEISDLEGKIALVKDIEDYIKKTNK